MTIDTKELKFNAFLRKMENIEIETNTTAKGETTIQQTPRNLIRREGLNALIEDLTLMYGEEFELVETKEGIILIAENKPCDFTFSWELKSTIKSLDFDPFIEANNFAEDQANKQAKKQLREREKLEHEVQLAEKRQRKLAELERKRELINK